MNKQIVAILGGFLVIILAWILFFAESQPVPEVKNNTIVWLGDSIGSGYGASDGNSPPEYLERMLGMPVVNASKSGDKTADGVAKIEAVIARDPGLVIIQLSGNDALQKRPISETKANLETMITTFLESGAAVALVGIRSGPFGDAYGDIFEDFADQYDLIYVEDALKGLFGDARYMADPIHPNDAGSEKIAERVYEVVAPIYK